MDKNAIKKYAVWARRELIDRVSQKAYQYGIRENDINDEDADSIDGKLLTNSEKKERTALIAEVKEKGFGQVMEEVAYTWFNRFSALRFMEVNGYLPTHVRVFTDDENNFKPQIITEAIHMELDGLDMDKVYAYVEANSKDELYKYLLITQCNALNNILPGMFQKIADYTELLFPDNLLREGSVIEQMIALITEDDWKDAVQIIGWLYQYYNSEPKDTVFANLKKNIKITKENVPAATQLFTPDWIVRYMVENSLGRLWLEGHPNDGLKSKWKYYLDEAHQQEDVQVQLDKIREEYKNIKPEEIRVIDPCMGSGHILVYAFDILMQIYEAYGYNQREAAKSIIENNIFGLDIDERAAQLAYFAVMMKARQYDRRFFSRYAQPHVYAIRESNHLDPFCVDYFVNSNVKLKADMQTLIDELHDAKEYGSILNVTNVDFDMMYARFDAIRNDINMARETTLNEMLPFIQVAQVMAQKYDVVVTNPPYMGSKGINDKLLQYITGEFSEGKSDIYSAFVLRAQEIVKKSGYIGLITPYVWMYLSSFQRFRENILKSSNIVSLIQLEYNAFEVACVPVCTYILCKNTLDYMGRYIQLSKFKGWEKQELCTLEAISDFTLDYCFEAQQSKYSLIAGTPIAYWLSNDMYSAFKETNKIIDFGTPKQGLITGDNNTYMRIWYEVNISRIDFGCNDSYKSHKKWFPHSKGGAVRRWYGNNEYVVNWENDGFELKNFTNEKGKLRSRPQNESSYFKRGITWSDLTISWFSARFVPEGFIFDGCGPTLFANNEDDLLYLCGYLNSGVFQEFLNISCQGMHYSNGVIGQLPFIMVNGEVRKEIETLVKINIEISKSDWDEAETSWGFKSNHFCYKQHGKYLQKLIDNYVKNKEEQIQYIKNNERRLDELFFDIFNIHKRKLSKGICPPTITVLGVREVVFSVISYSVGCMFGRYSLDVDGLAYAGGDLDVSKYKTYPVDKDNIIPICDDEYFQDDIMGRFIKFIETVYGADTLEENLKFIADALGGKGSSRDIIRNYFINEFYKDHCKMYQKRPIYWLFDSGKKNGFKALIYMHRYQPDTIARMRTDYVHEQQERYRTATAHLEQRINDDSTSERVKLNKQLCKLQDQATEIRIYEEKIHHLADKMIHIDLDDGVKHNYDIFGEVLAKIK